MHHFHLMPWELQDLTFGEERELVKQLNDLAKQARASTKKGRR